ncbi:MAG: OmpA family protein [Saprospirales bacterium]|nr:OmpA family protein [Saprospirales bacterium]
MYFSQREDTGWKRWTQPRRLAPPINSPSDDSQPFFNAATGYLYFTSDRDGSNDIFRLRIQEAEGQKEILVKGRIINSATGEPIGAKVLTGLTGGDTSAPITSLPTDTSAFACPKGEPPARGGKRRVYRPAATGPFRKETYYCKDYEVDLMLDPLAVDAKISLRPIFFERSKPIILPNSYGELDNLAILLLERPGISIRIEGHTDNIGEHKSLVDLSEKRAKAVKDFLVTKGVDPRRIDTVGFGPSRPVSDNKDEEQRGLNRRVEVRITKIAEAGK